MEKDTVTLKPAAEYIELISLLKLKGIAQTGGHAKLIVEDGLVLVNGEQELRKRKKLRAGDVVVVEGVTIEVKGKEE